MSQTFENKRQQEIDAYLEGKMSQDEVIAFEEKLAKDSVLKEDVLLQRSLHQSFNEDDWSTIPNEADNEELQSIKSALRNEDNTAISSTIRSVETHYLEVNTPSKKKGNTRFYMRVAIAAIVLALLTLPFLMQVNTTSHYVQYANWEDLPSLRTKGDTQAKIIEGESLYLSQKYKETIQYLEHNIAVNDPYYSYALIYTGASYFQTDNLEKAHETYDLLINSNTLQSSYGYWYKLLLYLKIDDTQKAKEILELILSNQDHYNYSEAKKLQKELEKE
ncbi:hypothetical protein [Dokdonia sp.]|uniref:tetratricopeptide repeat protein n=1 Tax=Dokdonia sp. TaxID=2024995 RepID=UPI00326409C9